MPAFSSNPLNKSSLSRKMQRNPVLFGLPFVLMMVGASYAMSYFTQTKYDYLDGKVTMVSKEQELGLKQNRKKFDIREEYFKISAAQDDSWEPKRIQRPNGLPEWGVPPPQPPSSSSQSKPGA